MASVKQSTDLCDDTVEEDAIASTPKRLPSSLIQFWSANKNNNTTSNSSNNNITNSSLLSTGSSVNRSLEVSRSTSSNNTTSVNHAINKRVISSNQKRAIVASPHKTSKDRVVAGASSPVWATPLKQKRGKGSGSGGGGATSSSVLPSSNNDSVVTAKSTPDSRGGYSEAVTPTVTALGSTPHRPLQRQQPLSAQQSPSTSSYSAESESTMHSCRSTLEGRMANADTGHEVDSDALLTTGTTGSNGGGAAAVDLDISGRVSIAERLSRWNLSTSNSNNTSVSSSHSKPNTTSVVGGTVGWMTHNSNNSNTSQMSDLNVSQNNNTSHSHSSSTGISKKWSPQVGHSISTSVSNTPPWSSAPPTPMRTATTALSSSYSKLNVSLDSSTLLPRALHKESNGAHDTSGSTASPTSTTRLRKALWETPVSEKSASGSGGSNTLPVTPWTPKSALRRTTISKASSERLNTSLDTAASSLSSSNSRSNSTSPFKHSISSRMRQSTLSTMDNHDEYNANKTLSRSLDLPSSSSSPVTEGCRRTWTASVESHREADAETEEAIEVTNTPVVVTATTLNGDGGDYAAAEHTLDTPTRSSRLSVSALITSMERQGPRDDSSKAAAAGPIPARLNPHRTSSGDSRGFVQEVEAAVPSPTVVLEDAAKETNHMAVEPGDDDVTTTTPIVRASASAVDTSVDVSVDSAALVSSDMPPVLVSPATPDHAGTLTESPSSSDSKNNNCNDSPKSSSTSESKNDNVTSTGSNSSLSSHFMDRIVAIEQAARAAAAAVTSGTTTSVSAAPPPTDSHADTSASLANNSSLDTTDEASTASCPEDGARMVDLSEACAMDKHYILDSDDDDGSPKHLHHGSSVSHASSRSHSSSVTRRPTNLSRTYSHNGSSSSIGGVVRRNDSYVSDTSSTEEIIESVRAAACESMSSTAKKDKEAWHEADTQETEDRSKFAATSDSQTNIEVAVVSRESSMESASQTVEAEELEPKEIIDPYLAALPGIDENREDILPVGSTKSEKDQETVQRNSLDNEDRETSYHSDSDDEIPGAAAIEILDALKSVDVSVAKSLSSNSTGKQIRFEDEIYGHVQQDLWKGSRTDHHDAPPDLDLTSIHSDADSLDNREHMIQLEDYNLNASMDSDCHNVSFDQSYGDQNRSNDTERMLANVINAAEEAVTKGQKEDADDGFHFRKPKDFDALGFRFSSETPDRAHALVRGDISPRFTAYSDGVGTYVHSNMDTPGKTILPPQQMDRLASWQTPRRANGLFDDPDHLSLMKSSVPEFEPDDDTSLSRRRKIRSVSDASSHGASKRGTDFGIDNSTPADDEKGKTKKAKKAKDKSYSLYSEAADDSSDSLSTLDNESYEGSDTDEGLDAFLFGALLDFVNPQDELSTADTFDSMSTSSDTFAHANRNIPTESIDQSASFTSLQNSIAVSLANAKKRGRRSQSRGSLPDLAKHSDSFVRFKNWWKQELVSGVINEDFNEPANDEGDTMTARDEHVVSVETLLNEEIEKILAGDMELFSAKKARNAADGNPDSSIEISSNPKQDWLDGLRSAVSIAQHGDIASRTAEALKDSYKSLKKEVKSFDTLDGIVQALKKTKITNISSENTTLMSVVEDTSKISQVNDGENEGVEINMAFDKDKGVIEKVSLQRVYSGSELELPGAELPRALLEEDNVAPDDSLEVLMSETNFAEAPVERDIRPVLENEPLESATILKEGRVASPDPNYVPAPPPGTKVKRKFRTPENSLVELSLDACSDTVQVFSDSASRTDFHDERIEETVESKSVASTIKTLYSAALSSSSLYKTKKTNREIPFDEPHATFDGVRVSELEEDYEFPPGANMLTMEERIANDNDLNSSHLDLELKLDGVEERSCNDGTSPNHVSEMDPQQAVVSDSTAKSALKADATAAFSNSFLSVKSALSSFSKDPHFFSQSIDDNGFSVAVSDPSFTTNDSVDSLEEATRTQISSSDGSPSRLSDNTESSDLSSVAKLVTEVPLKRRKPPRIHVTTNSADHIESSRSPTVKESTCDTDSVIAPLAASKKIRDLSDSNLTHFGEECELSTSLDPACPTHQAPPENLETTEDPIDSFPDSCMETHTIDSPLSSRQFLAESKEDTLWNAPPIPVFAEYDGMSKSRSYSVGDNKVRRTEFSSIPSIASIKAHSFCDIDEDFLELPDMEFISDFGNTSSKYIGKNMKRDFVKAPDFTERVRTTESKECRDDLNKDSDKEASSLDHDLSSSSVNSSVGVTDADSKQGEERPEFGSRSKEASLGDTMIEVRRNKGHSLRVLTRLRKLKFARNRASAKVRDTASARDENDPTSSTVPEDLSASELQMNDTTSAQPQYIAENDMTETLEDPEVFSSCLPKQDSISESLDDNDEWSEADPPLLPLDSDERRRSDSTKSAKDIASHILEESQAKKSLKAPYREPTTGTAKPQKVTKTPSEVDSNSTNRACDFTIDWTDESRKTNNEEVDFTSRGTKQTKSNTSDAATELAFTPSLGMIEGFFPPNPETKKPATPQSIDFPIHYAAKQTSFFSPVDDKSGWEDFSTTRFATKIWNTKATGVEKNHAEPVHKATDDAHKLLAPPKISRTSSNKGKARRSLRANEFEKLARGQALI